MLRNHLLPISGHLHRQMSLAAEVLGVDTAETLAELWLRERLDQEPVVLALEDKLKPLRAERKRLVEEAKREHGKRSAQSARFERIASKLS